MPVSLIAHYSRYRIVHSALVKAVKMPGGEVSAQFSDSVASQLKPLLEENAGHTCYELNAADMRARSVQNPNDPGATYRNKNGEDVRGYTHNATETCDNEDKATTARGKVIPGKEGGL